MTKDQATVWVEALRSGKYKQAKDYLKTKKGHCCLGVLCELSQKVKFTEHPQTSNSYAIKSGEHIFSSVLPIEIMNEFGLSDKQGYPKDRLLEIDGDTYEGLADANDKGVPFNKLADWIEENYMFL